MGTFPSTSHLQQAANNPIIEDKTKDRIKDLLKTIYEYNALSYPATIINPPFVGTVEEFFNDKKK